MGLENESVEKAVQTVTQFSANEKEKTNLKNKKIHSLFSFLFCTLSVYIPLLITDLQVRFGDYAALEDTIWGYHFAAIVLLLGTSFLNSAAFFRFFRTVRMQKTPSASKQTEL